MFVAAGDELEEQVRGVLVKRDVTYFVDDQEASGVVHQFLREFPAEMRFLKRGATQPDAEWKRTLCPALVDLIRMPSARWVLPVPGGPSRTTFSASERNTPVPRWAMRFRSAEGWCSTLNSSVRGNPVASAEQSLGAHQWQSPRSLRSRMISSSDGRGGGASTMICLG